MLFLVKRHLKLQICAKVFAKEKCSEVDRDGLVQSYCAGEGEVETAGEEESDRGCTVTVKCDASKGASDSKDGL